MAPILNHIFETVRTGNLKQNDGTTAQFRTLPFGGRYVARAALSENCVPQITSMLNESYFSNVLYNEENHTFSGMEPRTVKPDLNETAFAGALLNLKKHPHPALSAVPHITDHLNKTYFENTLLDAKNHTDVLYARNQINSTYNSPGPQPQPLSMQVQNQSTTLGLILVGIFILVGMLLYVKFIKRNTCVAWKERNNLDMEERGVGNYLAVSKREKLEQTKEVGDGTQWSNVAL